MTNEQMKANRFMNWHIAKCKLAAIIGAIHTGKVVIVCTGLRAWQFSQLAQINQFRATKSGLYMRRGKSWDCIDYAKITFWN